MLSPFLTITCGFSRNTRTCEDMYWTIGTVTATSRDWWRVFPLKITGSDHDSPSFRIRYTLSAPRAPGDRRHRTAASPGGPGVGARSTHDLGEYPGAVLSEKSRSVIRGEVFELPGDSKHAGIVGQL